MIIESADEFDNSDNLLYLNYPPRRRVLMVRPDHFDVVYAINPYMTDASGQLQKIDRRLAYQQWENLAEKYQELNFHVEVLEGLPQLPDMVFAANQSFPFWNDKTNRPAVIMSQMRSEFRRQEVASFDAWYHQQDYEVYGLDEGQCFEGNGDALLHPGKKLIWGGYGPRTDKSVYDNIEQITGYTIALLELKDPNFYHLDTCLSILDEHTAVIQPTAFTKAGLALLRTVFKKVIETDAVECSAFFTGNCHSPNGQDVILHKGATRLETALQAEGFSTHALDTSEYMKSGGSVFCMKMMCF